MDSKTVDNIWRKIRFTSVALDSKFDDYSLYLKRSDLYFDLQLYRLCLEDVDKAITLHPDRTEGFLRKSNAYIALQMFNEAEQTWKEYLRTKPLCILVEQQLKKVRYESIKRIGFDKNVCDRIAQMTNSVNSALDRALSMDQDEYDEEGKLSFNNLQQTSQLLQFDHNPVVTNSGQTSCTEPKMATEQMLTAQQMATAQLPESQPFSTQQPNLFVQPLQGESFKSVSMETTTSPLNNALDSYFVTTPTKRMLTDDRYSPRKPNKVRRCESVSLACEETSNQHVDLESLLKKLYKYPSLQKKLADTINNVYSADDSMISEQKKAVSLQTEPVHQQTSAFVKDRTFDVIDQFLDSITITGEGVNHSTFAMDSYEIDDYFSEPAYLAQDNDDDEDDDDDENNDDALPITNATDLPTETTNTGQHLALTTAVHSSNNSNNLNLPVSFELSSEALTLNANEAIKESRNCVGGEHLETVTDTASFHNTNNSNLVKNANQLIIRYPTNEQQVVKKKPRTRIKKKFKHVKPYPDLVKNLMQNLD